MAKISGGPILEVNAHPNGILKVTFDSGHSVILDMKCKFSGFRFGVLSNPCIFANVDTDGNFIHWRKDGMVVAELGFGEITTMVLGEAY